MSDNFLNKLIFGDVLDEIALNQLGNVQDILGKLYINNSLGGNGVTREVADEQDGEERGSPVSANGIQSDDSKYIEDQELSEND